MLLWEGGGGLELGRQRREVGVVVFGTMKGSAMTRGSSGAAWGRSATMATRQSRAAPTRGVRRRPALVARAHSASESLWVPPGLDLPNLRQELQRETTTMNSGAPASVSSGGYDEHRAKTPPPDLPSILLDARIVWLGMPIVSAVSELIIAQLLYLQYKEPGKDIYMYINSTGTCRADGSVVGYETEATAIYDTMNYVSSDIATINVGVAIGNSCMILAAGAKGKRAMLPNATAMLHQPRIPATGSRQAIEIAIKNREVQAQKNDMLGILSKHTGHSVEKLNADMQRPLYMQPKDALDYGIVDSVVESKRVENLIGDVKAAKQWDTEAGLVAK